MPTQLHSAAAAIQADGATVTHVGLAPKQMKLERLISAITILDAGAAKREDEASRLSNTGLMLNQL